MRRDERFTVDGHVQVEIELTAGSVTIRTSESGTVQVSADTNGSAELDISQMGDTIAVRQGRRSRSARVVLDVPVGTDVSVKGASVGVSARGALGSLRTKTASGDVDAEDVVRLDLSMSSGDARIGVVRDEASITTASGDAVVRSVGGRLQATLASGDLRAESVAGDIEAGTAAGDVVIGRCDGSVVAIRTVSGDIHIGLPGGIRVDPEISTMSGKVRLPDAAPVADPSVERRPVRLRLRTVSGDIRVDRAR